MWIKVLEKLRGYPERLAVAKLLIENGLSIRDGRIWCNAILISKTGIAKVAGVDTKTVRYTIKMMEEDNELCKIFKSIKSAGLSLEKIAKQLNLGGLEIISTDAKKYGILAQVSSLIAEADINIRQVIADDPEFLTEPKLILITERKIPGDLIPKLLKIEGVTKVTVY